MTAAADHCLSGRFGCLPGGAASAYCLLFLPPSPLPAGALIAFIFPAWVALRALGRGHPSALAAPRYWRWNAWALIALGLLQAAAGITATLFFSQPKDHGSNAAALLAYLF